MFTKCIPAEIVLLFAVTGAWAVEGKWTNYGNAWLGCAIQARDGALWVSGARGVSKYDLKTAREVARWGVRDGLTNLNLFSVCDIDRYTGDVWVGRSDGLSRWDGHAWHHYRGGKCGYAIAITKDNVWTGGPGEALMRFDKSGKLLKTYRPGEGSIPAGNIWFLRVDRDDENFLWMVHYISPVVEGRTLGFGKEAMEFWRRPDRPKLDPEHLGGLSKWDIRAEKCIAFHHPNNSAVPTNRGGALAEDSTGGIWFSGDEPSTGIGRLDKKTGKWTIFDRSSGCPAPNLNAWSLVVDTGDNLFCSTGHNFVYVRWSETGKWRTLRIPSRVEFGRELAGHDVAIMQNWQQWGPGDGGLYCATGWGVAHYERKTDSWRWLEDLGDASGVHLAPFLGANVIRQDQRGRIWLGGRALVCLDQGRTTVHPVGQCMEKHWNGIASMEFLDDKIWAIERLGGLVVFDTDKGTHESYQGAAVTRLGLASPRVASVGRGPQGRLWFGFAAAGLVQSYDGRQFKTYAAAETGGALTGSAKCAKADASGRLWLATSDALVSFDGKAWKRFGADAGTPQWGFTDLDFGDDGAIWLLGKETRWKTKLYRFDGQRFLPAGGPPGEATMVFVDRRGRVWSSDGRRAFWVRTGREWEAIDPDPGGPAGVRYLSACQAGDGRIFFGADKCSGGAGLTVYSD